MFDDETTVTDETRAAAYRALLVDIGRADNRNFSVARRVAGRMIDEHCDGARARLRTIHDAAYSWGLTSSWREVDHEMEAAGVPFDVQVEMFVATT